MLMWYAGDIYDYTRWYYQKLVQFVCYKKLARVSINLV